jgi:hypothetical protein
MDCQTQTVIDRKNGIVVQRESDVLFDDESEVDVEITK